jgi:HTH-type transcriptional regulator, sugar sensing transcriptional regulator
MTKYKSFLENNELELMKTLGVSEAELSVYLATLELGQAQIQEISRKSGVKRTSIYNFIDNLLARQFLSELKKGRRKLYSAAHPSALLHIQKSRVVSMERLIPELLAINNNARNKPRVSFHEGKAGMQEVYNIALHDKQTIYAWEDLDRMLAILPDFLRKYAVERSAKNIPLRSIMRDTPLAREFVQKNNVELSRDSRFVESEEFGTDIEVFGNKVALFSLRKDFPFAVLIDDAGIAKTLKIAWTELWDRLEPVPHE